MPGKNKCVNINILCSWVSIYVVLNIILLGFPKSTIFQFRFEVLMKKTRIIEEDFGSKISVFRATM